MHQQRKLDHLRICLDKSPQFANLSTGLERYRFVHQALPEIDLDSVSLTCQVLGKSLKAPLLISSMTGGTEEAEHVNLNLARAAQQLGVAMAVGSMRAALAQPSQLHTYQVRRVAPDVLLLANMGAVQLNNEHDTDDCRRVVEMIGADALILHLNPLHESLQAGGNTNFGSLLEKIEEVCHYLPVPVVVKEVGWGISDRVAEMLQNAGVAAIDVAGAGGTSWSAVETYRAPDEKTRNIAQAFADWGIPTADSIRMVRRSAPSVTIIGSGGIRTGVDVAKVIALGADAAAIAAPLLDAGTIGSQVVADRLEEVIAQLRIAMFCVGASTLTQLGSAPIMPVCPRYGGPNGMGEGTSPLPRHGEPKERPLP